MKVVTLVSGGMDSAVLLYHLLAEAHEVKAISFNYGQRHVRELIAADHIVRLAGVSHEVVDLSSIARLIAGQSSQVRAQGCPDVPVPEGHYSDPSMKATIVPNRNMIMLAVAAAHATAIGWDTVAYCAHSGDHAIYPDCRPKFVYALNEALFLGTEVRLFAPFMEYTKADLVRKGHNLGVPFQFTWTCYKGRLAHCGKCGACVERLEAFKLAGLTDPVLYTTAGV